MVEYNFDNSNAIGNSLQILQDFCDRSALFYAQNSEYIIRNLPYGDTVRQTFDWCCSKGEVKATLVFIHGGYWQYCRKEEFAFIAESLISIGYNVALVEYELAPQVSLTQISQQVGQALDVIAEYAKQEMLTEKPIVVCGHSAGGHLSALWHVKEYISMVVPISGVFDLAPLQATPFNTALQLTRQEIQCLSPILQPIRSIKMKIVVGEQELPAFLSQAATYYGWCQQFNPQVELICLADSNHFTILDRLFIQSDYWIDWLEELSMHQSV